MASQLDLGRLARWLYAVSSEVVKTDLEFAGETMTIGFRDTRRPVYHARWDVDLTEKLPLVRARIKRVRAAMTREIGRRA